MLALFLLLGAVVNVAVAWGCAVRPGEHSTLHDIEHYWPRGTPQGRPGPNWAVRYVGLGWTLDVFEYFPDGSGSPAEHDAALFRAGWPALTWHSMDWTDGPTKTLRRSAGWDVGLYTGEYPELPLRPIWPGFAINTLFYATLLWLLIPGPFALRRFIRRKRGQCPACGYPAGESAICSECGKELSKRLRPVT